MAFQLFGNFMLGLWLNVHVNVRVLEGNKRGLRNDKTFFAYFIIISCCCFYAYNLNSII